MPRTSLWLEDPDTEIEYEVIVDWSYSYDPGRYSGPPEKCYPAEENFYPDIVNANELPVNVLKQIEDDDTLYTLINPKDKAHYDED